MKSLIQSMLSYAIKKWEICWSHSAFEVINRFYSRNITQTFQHLLPGIQKSLYN